MDHLAPFSGNAYGATHYSPLGVSVVIGPEGFNADERATGAARPPDAQRPILR